MKPPVEEAFPGCFIANTSIGDIQFGSPSDIIKLLQNKNIPVPATLVLPDDFFAFGINQASIEFPLYYFLFIKQGFYNNGKFRLIGTPEQLKRARHILQLTLLGPTDTQMKTWHIKNVAAIRKELNFMALKKIGTDSIAKLTDIINFIPFKNNIVTVDTISITKSGQNTFILNDADNDPVHINTTLTEKQPPPLPIAPPERRVFGGILAMRAINTLSGFDPHGYTTGFILWVNGIMISIDGVSWMENHLHIHGISSEKLKTYILTHIHDDHSSIIDQIVSSKKITIITAKVVFESFIHKLSAILDSPPSTIRKLVNFIEITPGKSQTIFGARFDFWYTLHSIPTIGFKVTIHEKSYIFTGDMTYGPKLEEAYKKKVISKEKYDFQKSLPHQHNATRIFFDGGGGEIHPNPEDIKSIGKNVIFFHTGELGKNLRNIASLARAGTTWITIPSKQMFIDDITTILNSPLFKDASLEWQRVLLNSSTVQNINREDFVIKAGESGGSFYSVISGTFLVISQNKVVTFLQEGDFFGEASLIFNKLRNISIKALTPGAVLWMPGDIFYQYATESGIDQRLRKIKNTKPLIMKLSLFQNMNSNMTNWVSEITEHITYEPGDIIIKEGAAATHFFVIQSGKVTVSKLYGRKKIELAELGAGQFIGEMGILGPEPITSATVRAVNRVKVFRFSPEHLEHIMETNPYLNLIIGKVIEQRLENNRKKGLKTIS